MVLNATSANKLANATINLLVNLYDRWLDECKYEDFGEYVKVMQKSVDKALGEHIEIKGTKRPFGYVVVTDYRFKDGVVRKAKISVNCTSRNAGWSAKVA